MASAEEGASLVEAMEDASAAVAIRDGLAAAINSASPHVRQFQAELCDSGALRQLYNLAVQRQPIAFEALRLLAYRNRIGVQQMVNLGAIELLEQILVREAHSGAASMALQAAALQLLTSLLAFNLEVHSTVMHTKLVKRLVQLCRPGGADGRGHGQSIDGRPHDSAGTAADIAGGGAAQGPDTPGAGDSSRGGSPDADGAAGREGGEREGEQGEAAEGHDSGAGKQVTMHPDAPIILSSEQQSMAACAAAALRNLCHQIANHPGLLAVGAALELAAVMQREPDPYRRINATMAVALLVGWVVGHEEQHPLLRMDEAGMKEMLTVLSCARARVMCHGYFWTCWKVCQALARLSANEDNKPILTREGGVGVLAEVLCADEHARKAITVKYCVEALWNLAFYEPAREQILAHPALVAAICAARQSGLDLVREVARGCLFTLGVNEHGQRRAPHVANGGAADAAQHHQSQGHHSRHGHGHGHGHGQGHPGGAYDEPPAHLGSDGNPQAHSHSHGHGQGQGHGHADHHQQHQQHQGPPSGGPQRGPPRCTVSNRQEPPGSAAMAAAAAAQAGPGAGLDGETWQASAWHVPSAVHGRIDEDGVTLPPALAVAMSSVCSSIIAGAPPGTEAGGVHGPSLQSHSALQLPLGLPLPSADARARRLSLSARPAQDAWTGSAGGAGPMPPLSPRGAHQLQAAALSQQAQQQQQSRPKLQRTASSASSRTSTVTNGPAAASTGAAALSPPYSSSLYALTPAAQAGGGLQGHGHSQSLAQMSTASSITMGGGGGSAPTAHIMVSYEWGSQQKALLIKEALERRGLVTWMDIEKMSGSTLEAMALAVEGAAAVLLCISKRYKESQACRAEAEYAYQQRKRIIPIMMERGYRPTGWLGILIGTKLYFDCSERRLIPERMGALERELGPLARQCRRHTTSTLSAHPLHYTPQELQQHTASLAYQNQAQGSATSLPQLPYPSQGPGPVSSHTSPPLPHHAWGSQESSLTELDLCMGVEHSPRPQPPRGTRGRMSLDIPRTQVGAFGVGAFGGGAVPAGAAGGPWVVGRSSFRSLMGGAEAELEPWSEATVAPSSLPMPPPLAAFEGSPTSASAAHTSAPSHIVGRDARRSGGGGMGMRGVAGLRAFAGQGHGQSETPRSPLQLLLQQHQARLAAEDGAGRHHAGTMSGCSSNGDLAALTAATAMCGDGSSAAGSSGRSSRLPTPPRGATHGRQPQPFEAQEAASGSVSVCSHTCSDPHHADLHDMHGTTAANGTRGVVGNAQHGAAAAAAGSLGSAGSYASANNSVTSAQGLCLVAAALHPHHNHHSNGHQHRDHHNADDSAPRLVDNFASEASSAGPPGPSAAAEAAAACLVEPESGNDDMSSIEPSPQVRSRQPHRLAIVDAELDSQQQSGSGQDPSMGDGRGGTRGCGVGPGVTARRQASAPHAIAAAGLRHAGTSTSLTAPSECAASDYPGSGHGVGYAGAPSDVDSVAMGADTDIFTGSGPSIALAATQGASRTRRELLRREKGHVLPLVSGGSSNGRDEGRCGTSVDAEEGEEAGMIRLKASGSGSLEADGGLPSHINGDLLGLPSAWGRDAAEQFVHVLSSGPLPTAERGLASPGEGEGDADAAAAAMLVHTASIFTTAAATASAPSSVASSQRLPNVGQGGLSSGAGSGPGGLPSGIGSGPAGLPSGGGSGRYGSSSHWHSSVLGPLRSGPGGANIVAADFVAAFGSVMPTAPSGRVSSEGQRSLSHLSSDNVTANWLSRLSASHHRAMSPGRAHGPAQVHAQARHVAPPDSGTSGVAASTPFAALASAAGSLPLPGVPPSQPASSAVPAAAAPAGATGAQAGAAALPPDEAPAAPAAPATYLRTPLLASLLRPVTAVLASVVGGRRSSGTGTGRSCSGAGKKSSRAASLAADGATPATGRGSSVDSMFVNVGDAAAAGAAIRTSEAAPSLPSARGSAARGSIEAHPVMFDSDPHDSHPTTGEAGLASPATTAHGELSSSEAVPAAAQCRSTTTSMDRGSRLGAFGSPCLDGAGSASLGHMALAAAAVGNRAAIVSPTAAASASGFQAGGAAAAGSAAAVVAAPQGRHSLSGPQLHAGSVAAAGVVSPFAASAGLPSQVERPSLEKSSVAVVAAAAVSMSAANGALQGPAAGPAAGAAAAPQSALVAAKWKALSWARGSPSAAEAAAAAVTAARGALPNALVVAMASAASGVDGDADDLVGERLAMLLDGSGRRSLAVERRPAAHDVGDDGGVGAGRGAGPTRLGRVAEAPGSAYEPGPAPHNSRRSVDIPWSVWRSGAAPTPQFEQEGEDEFRDAMEDASHERALMVIGSSSRKNAGVAAAGDDTTGELAEELLGEERDPEDEHDGDADERGRDYDGYDGYDEFYDGDENGFGTPGRPRVSGEGALGYGELGGAASGGLDGMGGMGGGEHHGEGGEEEEAVDVPSSTSVLVEKWGGAQVRDWLVRVGHGELADGFEEQGITGRALCGLMRVMKGGGGAAVVRDMLRDELGVRGLAAQLELLEELHKLFD
eukprot:XP_001703348.1 predicted protein [Chlamydomonas reinhardtii]